MANSERRYWEGYALRNNLRPVLPVERLHHLFAGKSPRWLWWLSLGLFLGGIVLAVQIYESGLSFFLRRPDTSTTVHAVLVATVAAGIFAVVTVRRANALSVRWAMRWTLLLPPFWVLWIPALGLIKTLTPEDWKRIGWWIRQFVMVFMTSAAAVLAIAWWHTKEARETIINASDDVEIHRDAFTKAARALISQGRCTEADFLDHGGWAKSTAQGEGIYFTYCGGSTIANRLYLDVNTGRVFQ